MPKWGWVVLFLALIFGFIFALGSNFFAGIMSCIILIVPVLYFLKWDYKAIFQKPSARDIGLAIALFAGYMIYAILIAFALEAVGINVGGADTSAVDLSIVPPMIFLLMGEEFVKFIPFMFLLRVIYKYSNNRKVSVILSMILVMIMFAAMHADSYMMLIFALFVQGFGSIFEFYGYIKTKNMLIPYITHLCTDVFIMMIPTRFTNSRLALTNTLSWTIGTMKSLHRLSNGKREMKWPITQEYCSAILCRLQYMTIR